MADIADNVVAILTAVEGLQTAVADLTTAVKAIQQPPAATVDLTPVLNAIAALQKTEDTVAADLQPTSPASGATGS